MSRTSLLALVVLVALVVGGVLVVSGALGSAAGPSPSATLPPIPAATTVSADARVVPARFAELAAPAGGGVVADVLVEAGDRVPADGPLLRLDTTLADAEVAQAEAGLAAAQAAAEQATAAARQAAFAVTATDATVDQAQAAVRAADATRDGTPSGTTARRAADAEVTRASAALRAARADLSAARNARTGANSAAAAAAAEVTGAEGAVAAAVEARDRLTLTAPFAGTVASIDAVVGETLEPGVPAARVADLSSFRFETTDLDETAVGRIGDGATATVTVDAYPDAPIAARVTSIAPFGEESSGDVVYTVLLEPTGEVPEGLRWNMTASVSIDVEEAS